jgi:hypothetical protein
MISPFAAIVAVAIVFYLVIPGIGAVGVRHRWRRFRRRVIEASLLPLASYATVRHRRNEQRTACDARFLGTLESIQGEHTAWIRGPDITIAVDMSVSEIYLVAHTDEASERPRSEGPHASPPDAPPARTTWSRLGSLPEGTKVLVSGRLDPSGAYPTIRSADGVPVLAVFYDGSEPSLVRRCIWSGRQQNEYWNSVTPGALASGAFALILFAYLLLRQPLAIEYSRLAIALAAMPLMPLLPPGVVFFYLYRQWWRRGRTYRARRDVLQLPQRYLPDDRTCAPLPNGELYGRFEHDRCVVQPLASNGLTLIEPTLGNPPYRYTVFGHAVAAALAPPTDPLCEWTAIHGDPAPASLSCRHRARRYEVVSWVVLGAGLMINFVLLMAALTAIL